MKMKIKALVMDVDGTLTDGKVYMSANGELFKAFDIKDGCGIKDILPRYDIVPIIITARQSTSLEKRCKELGITELHQGCRDKLSKLKEILANYPDEYNLSNAAYIGDDFLDLECMLAIKKAGGFAVCPSDAIDQIKDIADYICSHTAGNGAVREFIDWYVILNNNTAINKISNISISAANFISNMYNNHLCDGSYILDDGVIANLMTYITKPAVLTTYETHRKYIDVQYIIYGEELMLTESLDRIKEYRVGSYDAEKDVEFYNYTSGNCSCLKAGEVVVLYPNDAHRGAIAVDVPSKIRKIVFKVPV